MVGANLMDAHLKDTAKAVDAIQYMDVADVRPVVLCRDCKHFQQFRAHDGFCQIDGMLYNNDFFCANGAKMEES